MTHGFTLTEVLISLFLVTSTSLALLQQQWHVSQLYNQAHARMIRLLVLDNASEQQLMGRVE